MNRLFQRLFRINYAISTLCASFCPFLFAHHALFLPKNAISIPRLNTFCVVLLAVKYGFSAITG